MRLAEKFINNRGLYLGDYGYKLCTNQVELKKDTIVFYHYTRSEHLSSIFSEDGGLYARRTVDCPNVPEEFKGCYLVEGFLEQLPKWLYEGFYFKNLGLELVKSNLGSVLLKIELPKDFPNLYIADYAHVLEDRHIDLVGGSPLGLEYDCLNGHEVTQAYVNSYIPIKEYKGKHIAPLMQVLRRGEGIAVPNKYISISEMQPIADNY